MMPDPVGVMSERWKPLRNALDCAPFGEHPMIGSLLLAGRRRPPLENASRRLTTLLVGPAFAQGVPVNDARRSAGADRNCMQKAAAASHRRPSLSRSNAQPDDAGYVRAIAQAGTNVVSGSG